jgi:hypothetical protein
VTDDRPPIPRRTKQKVRQRCGFGCVVCGRPIYHYDHIIEYCICREHKAENLTLLCPEHHDEKTRGWLRVEDVQAANKKPFNRQSGRSAPFRLRYQDQKPVVALGEDLAIKVEKVERGIDAIVIDGVPIVGFRFDDGQCLLQMRLFDRDDHEVLTVVDNELTYSVDTWDFEFVGRQLTVRSAHREILVELQFRPPTTLAVSKGTLRYHGVEVQVWPEAVAVINDASAFSGFTARFQNFTRSHGVPVFLGLGDNPDNRWIGVPLPNIPREGYDRKANLAAINRFRAEQRARIAQNRARGLVAPETNTD